MVGNSQGWTLRWVAVTFEQDCIGWDTREGSGGLLLEGGDSIGGYEAE